MKVIVIGDGKVGRTIVEQVCEEGHEVVVIDTKSESIEQAIDKNDVMGIVGNGASYDILKSAGADKANVVIAATSSDETNILSCLIAKKLGAKATIARVRSYDYFNQTNIIKKDLGITMTFNPEYEASMEIMKIINFPEAIRVDSFAKGNVDLVELYLPVNSPLIGKSLIEIYQQYQVKVLVCAVQRDEEVFIPTGGFIFKEKDKIHITAKRSDLKRFLKKLGLIEDKINSVMLIGGGKLSLYLAKELLKYKYNVKIIEQDYKRCLELSELLPQASIIHGDGTDQTILDEEGIKDSDAVVCLTSTDEENIILSMYAHKLKVHKIITKINRPTFVGLMEAISTASVISPKEIVASKIISHLRARNNARGSNVVTLHKLVNNKVEALEFIAKENKKIVNICLKDLKLKDNILIAGIIRDGKAIIPNGNDMILENDNVIIVTTNQFLDDLNEILA